MKKILAFLAVGLFVAGIGSAQALDELTSLEVLCGTSLDADTKVTGAKEKIASNCNIDINTHRLILKGNKITMKNGGSYKNLIITGTSGRIDISEWNSLSGAKVHLKTTGSGGWGGHITMNRSSIWSKSGAPNDIEIFSEYGQVHIRFSSLSAGDDLELVARRDKMFLLQNDLNAKDDIRFIGDTYNNKPLYFLENAVILFGTVDDHDPGANFDITADNVIDESPEPTIY